MLLRRAGSSASAGLSCLRLYLLFYYSCYTNQTIGDIVSNFVAMATSISRRKFRPI